jgi:hypothetical protein
LEGSTLEKTVAAATLSTISETKNEPHIQLDIVPQQKAFPYFSCIVLSFSNAGIEFNYTTILIILLILSRVLR